MCECVFVHLCVCMCVYVYMHMLCRYVCMCNVVPINRITIGNSRLLENLSLSVLVSFKVAISAY